MAIALDSNSSTTVSNNSIGVLSHTCTNTSLDGILLVALSSDGGGFNTIDNWIVNYNSISLSRIALKEYTNVTASATAIYILENPPVGTFFIGVGTGGPLEYFRIFAASFTGVETGGGYTVATNSGDGISSGPSVTITTTVDNCVIYDSANCSLQNSNFTATSGQTILNEGNIGTGFVSHGAHSYESVTSATSYSQNYTLAAAQGVWTSCAVSLRPAGGRMKMIGVGSITFS